MAKVDPIGEHMEARDLELNLLRTFLAVVWHGSMGKTPAAARVTRPPRVLRKAESILP